MTNKPFEVQDSAIVLNGVPLEITEGGSININNNPVAGGDRLTNGENEFVLTEQGTVELNGQPFTGGSGGSLSVGNGQGPGIENVTGIIINGDVTELAPGLVGISIEGAVPTVANTKKGFINLVGDRPNNQDEAWFESVAVNDSYAYVGGGDYYTNGSTDLSKIYKFNLETGEQVWVKEIVAGRDAQFDFSITSEVITITQIAQGGQGYIAQEELIFPGWIWNGQEVTNRVIVVVETVDAETGAILTASIKPGYNLTGIADTTVTGLVAENNNARGQVNSIVYDTFTDKLILVTEYRSGLGDLDFDSSYYWTNLYIIDPVTGNIDQTATLSTEGDVNANSIKVNNTEGGVVVVGEKYGEWREFGTLTLLAGYNGYFDVLKSEIDAEHYPGSPYDSYYDFWVSGTGISSYNNVDNVNYYEGLTTTVLEGSGAEFVVNDNGDGTYADAPSITPTGSNYLVGHKIKILGTSLGGTTPTNDAILTVASVDAGAITGYTISGTAAGSVVTPYAGVTGTNYNVGSGAQFYVNVSTINGTFDGLGVFNGGSNYVPGDILTVAGTSFAGGTVPENNLAIVVGSVDPGGIVTSYNPEGTGGTASSTALRIYVNGVDFSVEGTWSMKQNLGGEALVWTPTWTNAIGGPSGDRFFDACWSQDNGSIFAVGRGRYETTYNQALVVKFDGATGAVVWGKDIKFSEAADNDREARSVCLVPGSSDIIVAGAWYNNSFGVDELILTRMTEAGVAVWQKTYQWNFNGSTLGIDYEMKVEAFNNNIIVSLEASTPEHSRGLSYLIVDPATGAVIDNRVLSSDGNGNYNYYDTPTPSFSSVYTDDNGDDYIVFAGHTYVPTDNYYNALLVKLPLDGYKTLAAGDYVSLGEHILGKYNWDVTTVTSAFDSFTATEHLNTIVMLGGERGYNTATPQGLLNVWTYTITDDSAGYLEFGDGSRQSFATDKIPQIPAASDYYLTEQDSGKHIFFENESGEVFIPHWTNKNLPVGFAFTVVNTTGNTCYVTCESGEIGSRGSMKLAGRNLEVSFLGIPDSGSGSMVTFLKIKSGYDMSNTDYEGVYNDVWIVSGPGDLFDAD